MTQTRSHCATAFLFVFVSAVTTQSAQAADPLVEVSFTGVNPTTGDKLTGYFWYDPLLQGSASFDFSGLEATYKHRTYYKINNKTYGPYDGPYDDPFLITPSVNGAAVFQLLATGPTSTALTINLATQSPDSSNALPTCSNANFVARPTGTQSQFMMQPAGQLTPTVFNITSVTCTPLLLVAPFPIQPCYYDPCPAPAPCPLYVFQTRPKCCLSGLFGRGAFRLGCR